MAGAGGPEGASGSRAQKLYGDVVFGEVSLIGRQEDALGVLGKGGNQDVGCSMATALGTGRVTVCAGRGRHGRGEIQEDQAGQKRIHVWIGALWGASIELGQGCLLYTSRCV